jgi:hypothetical protein
MVPRMNAILLPRVLAFATTVSCWLVLVESAFAAATFPGVAELESQPGWPDPLVFFNGERVTNRAQWVEQRRPELQALFQHYMYGTVPPAPATRQLKTNLVDRQFLRGQATLKLVEISFGSDAAPRLDLMLVVPNARPGPAPVFLALNFCGNHALVTDPRIPLTRGWLYNSCQGCPNNHATDAARGGQAQDWPLSEIIARGYALASFCNSDLDSDRADVSDGLYAWLALRQGEPAANRPHDRGSLAAWAWGFHRAVDYLVTDADLDAQRIAAVGHSRNGKTALLAAAFDERIALAIPHQAGCGGTAPSRGRIGESVKQINDRFPHWFNAQFKQFNEQPDKLPFDQHSLVALMAPRPVLLSNAIEDQWANPNGQFEMLQAAEPVYRFLGAGALGTRQVPPLGQLVDSRLGYFIRAGKHSMTAGDWRVFLDFADKHFGKPLKR